MEIQVKINSRPFLFARQGPGSCYFTSPLYIQVQTSEFVFKLQFSESFDQSRQFDASCTETANTRQIFLISTS